MNISYLYVRVLILLTSLAFFTSSLSAQKSYQFNFNTEKPGFTLVLPAAIYSKEIGYGFEAGAVLASHHNSKQSKFSDSLISEKPFYFSAALPEGNYRVTVTFGTSSMATDTTVKAELRRLMLEKVTTAKGKFISQSFIVNVRTPKFSGGEVKLKDREKTSEQWAWDEKLTLEFNGAHPAICAIEIVPVNVPTIFLLGDSTITDQPREPYNSWGQMLPRFFKPEIAIANHAESGESVKSSLGAKRFAKVMSLMKAGDYLFMQFGHNDQKEKGEGIGAFTSYKSDLKKIVNDVRKRGGIAVLITSVNRRNFDEKGNVFNTLGDYPEAVRELAREEKIALIDLNAMSKIFYEALGAENSKLAFKDGDATHHSNYGSYELAKCIVEGVKKNRLSLAKYLMKDVMTFDPRHPDSFENFNILASPMFTETKPLGN